MKETKKVDEKELAVKTPAQAEQILEQETTHEEPAADALAQQSQGAPAGRGGRKRGDRKPVSKKTSSLTDSGMIEKVVSINR
ncbi:MAG: hypothetical protein HQL13_07100 [Candidatus Omnitrophica bacterium]|nr:hypothetical protein [Candidatus Omnitrophota bacterium]